MKIKQAEFQWEINSSDDLLFNTMFKPLNMDRSIKEELKVPGVEFHFVALESDMVVGSMVVVINNNSAELRHAAVDEMYRNKGIGKQIWEEVKQFLFIKGINEIELFSRNTALEFWSKLGFYETSEWLDHEKFLRHGIRYKKMKCII